jgi:hypothetical protein
MVRIYFLQLMAGLIEAPCGHMAVIKTIVKLPLYGSVVKVHKRGNFWAPILNLVLFHSQLCFNIKVSPPELFDCVVIKGDKIVQQNRLQLILRLSRIRFHLY